MRRPIPALILASESPRRKELLKRFRLPFKVIPSRMLEPPPGPLDPVTYTRKLALAKAQIVARHVGKGLILGADTVVVLRNQIIGKPTNFTQACQFLSRLQGTTHKVITAIALVDGASGKTMTGHAVSFVAMRRLTPLEIARVAQRHQDKAGAYAVQEKGDSLVVKVKGSYTNVVGLPLELLKTLLKKF